MNQSRVVFVHLCEKGQIGLDIGLVSESVLREKHRKLSLSTDGGTKGFGVEGKFLTGELILKIKLQDIVGQSVGFGECLGRENGAAPPGNFPEPGRKPPGLRAPRFRE